MSTLSCSISQVKNNLPKFKITDPVKYWSGLLGVTQASKIGEFKAGTLPKDTSISGLDGDVRFQFDLGGSAGRYFDPVAKVIKIRPLIRARIDLPFEEQQEWLDSDNEKSRFRGINFNAGLHIEQDPLTASGRMFVNSPSNGAYGVETYSKGEVSEDVYHIHGSPYDPYSQREGLGHPIRNNFYAAFQRLAYLYHYILEREGNIEGINLEDPDLST